MTVSVRAARSEDIDTLVALNRGVQRHHAELEPTFFKAELNDDEVGSFFARKLADPAHHIWLAMTERGPCGYVWFEVEERPEKPFTLPLRRIYVHHLSVQPAERRKGVASALLDRVDGEAQAAGIDVVALDTWAANAAARGFFTARGFMAFSVGLRMRPRMPGTEADRSGKPRNA